MTYDLQHGHCQGVVNHVSKFRWRAISQQCTYIRMTERALCHRWCISRDTGGAFKAALSHGRPTAEGCCDTQATRCQGLACSLCNAAVVGVLLHEAKLRRLVNSSTCYKAKAHFVGTMSLTECLLTPHSICGLSTMFLVYLCDQSYIWRRVSSRAYMK